MSAERPFFTIVMPVYNHEAYVARAVRSCLEQSFDDFEIVAVDDASTDGSVAVLESFHDPRIRVIRHERNRGVCPTRNTAMAHGRGEWFVYFDSDDELLPGALEAIHRRAAAAPPDVGGLRFAAFDERGLSVDPPHDDRYWTYDDFARWLDVAIERRHEALPCMRASLFPEVRFSDDRSSELSFHLDLFVRGRVQACTDVVRRYHHHPGERITAPPLAKAQAIAADTADGVERLLAGHGDAIRVAPHLWWRLLSTAAMSSFVAGRPRAGWHWAWQALKARPFAARSWIVPALGVAGRRPALWLSWAARETKRRLQHQGATNG